MNPDVIIPAIIGATGALVVFWLSHSATVARERSKLLTSKLEELFLALIEFQKAIKIREPNEYSTYKEQASDIASALTRIQMIQDLYFSELASDTSKVIESTKKFTAQLDEFTPHLETMEYHHHDPLKSIQTFEKALSPKRDALLHDLNRLKERMVADKAELSELNNLYD